MYMVEEVLQVPLGKHVGARKYLTEVQDVMRQQPGFKGSQVCAYLGHIRQHLFLQFWEDSTAYKDWSGSNQAEELRQALPPRLYAVQPGGMYWKLLLETPGDSEGTFINQGMLQVLDEARWEEFLAQRHEHDANALAAGGMVYVQCYKYVGETLGEHYTPLTTLVLVRRSSRADYERSVERSAAQEFAKAPVYKSISHEMPNVTGLYDVIQEVNAGG